MYLLYDRNHVSDLIGNFRPLPNLLGTQHPPAFLYTDVVLVVVVERLDNVEVQLAQYDKRGVEPRWYSATEGKQ